MLFDATAVYQTILMASETKPAMVLPNHVVDISELLRIVKLLQLLDFKGCLNHGYCAADSECCGNQDCKTLLK